MFLVKIFILQVDFEVSLPKTTICKSQNEGFCEILNDNPSADRNVKNIKVFKRFK